MRIGTLSNEFVTYAYQEERDYEAIDDRFLRNTLKAIDYLYKNSLLTISFEDDGEMKHVDIIDVLVADTAHEISIVSGPKNAYNPALNSVMFLDTHGAVFRKNHRKKWFQSNKGFNSPVALLSHELIHCYNELYQTEDYHERKQDHSPRNEKVDHDGRDLSFPNAEEAFVIKMTNQVAKRLGEDKRSNYGRSYYPVEDVLSTKKKRKG
ncbi:hypothetical protein [Ulvibacter litoralis]|uniref:Effector protein n=1 Tax=Ulvibacter litoralis TaxID=227084 RepID=A0A1G7D4X2_9FLAO|nr:hypothetical protein [Ulvibacter litoralis]GHC44854.1 hypothetical protein GCM10008083_04360 [Ulvibacter litoralis]SDE46543.1 hypothetical protein SAMN05421855_101770 [Ulvibacter litoralis]